MILIDDKKLIPAPFISFNREGAFTPDGRPLSSLYRLSLQGTLLPNRGSPMSTGFWTVDDNPPDETFSTDPSRHNALLAKQELLREVLRTPGFKLSYYPTGLNPIECYPVLRSINFEPGTWSILSNYSIELEARTLNRSGTLAYEDDPSLGASGLFLSNVSDTWDVKEQDDGTRIYDVNRSVSATAFTNYISGVILGGEAWKNARTWVQNRISGIGLENNHFGLPTGINPTGMYNLITTENIDKVGGTYSLSQRYIANNANYFEKRSVSYNTTSPINEDNDSTITNISVNGTIQGLASGNDPSVKVSGALARWTTIESLIGVEIGAYGSPTTSNYTIDRQNGKLDYSQTYINATGSIYKHNYDVSVSIGPDVPTVSINGTIQGITLDSFYGASNQRFLNAISGFQILEPSLKTLACAYGGTLFFNTSMSGNFSTAPLNKSISYNKPVGSINYTYTFSFLPTGSNITGHIDNYTVELNSTNSTATTAGLISSATVNGTIQGLATNDDPNTKIGNAEIAWSTISSLIYTRASGEFSKLGGTTPALNNRVITKSVNVNRVAGIIGYSYAFNNTLAPTDATVAIADVSIDETWPNDVVVEQVIPGRISGPIIQNIGTKTAYRRTINVALTMYPKSGSHWDWISRGTPRAVASGYIASGVSDLGIYSTGWFIVGKSENWDWKNGFFTTTVNILATGLGS